MASMLSSPPERSASALVIMRPSIRETLHTAGRLSFTAKPRVTASVTMPERAVRLAVCSLRCARTGQPLSSLFNLHFAFCDWRFALNFFVSLHSPTYSLFHLLAHSASYSASTVSPPYTWSPNFTLILMSSSKTTTSAWDPRLIKEILSPMLSRSPSLT